MTIRPYVNLRETLTVTDIYFVDERSQRQELRAQSRYLIAIYYVITYFLFIEKETRLKLVFLSKVIGVRNVEDTLRCTEE